MFDVIPTNPPNMVIAVQHDLTHIAETTTQSTVNTALKQTEWTWNDIMIGFNEVGYQPSPDEKERICKRVFNKKFEYLLKKENGYYAK